MLDKPDDLCYTIITKEKEKGDKKMFKVVIECWNGHDDYFFDTEKQAIDFVNGYDLDYEEEIFIEKI